MGKRKKNNALEWEKEGNSNISARIFHSMMKSNAYKDLTAQARDLYTHMKCQLYFVPQDKKPQNDNNLFVFNRSLYKITYELFCNGEQFNKYCHELIAHGFIELYENGQTTRTKNIYKFSNKWKNWKPGTDYRPEAMKVEDMELLEKRRKQKKDWLVKTYNQD